METFGLFNLLENLLSTPSKPVEAQQTNDETPPKAAPPSQNETKTVNPCQNFLERHERISHRIKK